MIAVRDPLDHLEDGPVVNPGHDRPASSHLG
jgi:hypothetical protein